MVVGELEEACVDLHLVGGRRLDVLGRLVPRGNLRAARRQLRVLRDHAELLLLREGSPRSASQPSSKAPLYLSDHSAVRGAARGRARREVGEERLVRHQRLLLVHPLDRLVGHVLHEVVALFGRLLGLDGDRALVDRPGSTGGSSPPMKP